MTLQIFWPKPGNPREGWQKGGTNGREGGGEGGSRAKPGTQLVALYSAIEGLGQAVTEGHFCCILP